MKNQTTNTLKDLLNAPTVGNNIGSMIRRPVTIYVSLDELKQLMQDSNQSEHLTYQWAKAYCNAYKKVNSSS